MTNPDSGFNLVDDPWIELGDHPVSIREALLSGHELPGWPSGEPAAGPVIIRLLMPIVYRVTGMDGELGGRRRFAQRQAELLSSGRFDVTSVEDYIDRYRDRFWLTGPPAGLPPFAQDPTLAALEMQPVAKLVATWASGNNPALGPHAPVAEIDNASAARWLLIAHGYSAGGIYTGRVADQPRISCQASRLRRTVSIHPIGATFTETLLHHLVPVPDGWELGCPVWEIPVPRNPTARPESRAGLLEQLSGRHDKAILMDAEADGSVHGVVLSAGPGREPGLECPDPYTVMTAGREAHRQSAGRDAWRDIDALAIHSEYVPADDQLEARILDWCRESSELSADPGRWALISHRSVQSKEHAWGLTSLPDIIGLFSAGGAANTASAVIAASEDASTYMAMRLRALSGVLGRDGRSTRYGDARRAFWSLAEQTFWEAVTAESPDPTPDADWVSLLRHHALAGFDAATAHLIQVPRTHLEVERFRSEVSRWTWPKPPRIKQPTEGRITT